MQAAGRSGRDRVRAARKRRGLAAVAVVLLAAAGCDATADDDGTAADDAAKELSSAEQAAEAGPAGPSGSLRLTGYVEEHPRMVALALRGVEIDEGGHILLEIEGVNRGFRGRSSATIAEFGVRVRDDLGNSYPFQRPEGNGGLQFLADERLTGTLAFEGPIDPEARYLEVGFNQSSGESVSASEDSIDQYPRFLFEQVPLPGVGLEEEAERGPSSDLMAEQVVEVGQSAQIEGRDDLEVTLVRYVVGGGVITFELEAANTGDVTVDLARGVTRLLDGQDTTFVLESNSEDDGERLLRLEPGEELTGTLAFRGVIAEDAESLTLYTNANARSCDACKQTPYIEFTDIPVAD